MSAVDEANAALAEARGWLATHPHHHSARKSDVKRLSGALTALLAETQEPEWQYGVGWQYRDNFISGFAMDSLEGAQEHVATHPADEDGLEFFVVRRRPERFAGQWEPIGGTS